MGQPPPVTASAADTNVPMPVRTFSLLHAPVNATLAKISSTNAAFYWRPWVDIANTTNLIALKVADNAIPGLCATQSFLVTVNPFTLPYSFSSVWSNGQFGLQVANGQTGPD